MPAFRDENTPMNTQAEERILIEVAKQEHRETTAAAERALQIAVTTAETARATVEELHRQGRQLECADEGVNQIQEDVKEASSILRFMRRFCCFAMATSCCGCADPDAARDATRRQRVQQMQQRRHDAAVEAGVRHAVKQEQVDGLIRKANRAEPAGDEAARGELLGEGGAIRARRARQAQQRLGQELPAPDRAEVLRETRLQDDCLDRIGEAVEALAIMGRAMGEEMEEQGPKLERLGERVGVAHEELRTLGREAACMAGRRPRESYAGSGAGGLGTQAAVAATAARYSAQATRLMA